MMRVADMQIDKDTK